MTITLFQAFLVSCVVWIGFLDRALLSMFLYRPIVVGPAVGLILGDLKTGLEVGVAIELMFLAVVWVGSAIPPDETISTAIAAALAIAAGGRVDIGIAAALPIAIIGQMGRYSRHAIFLVTGQALEKSVEKLSTTGIILYATILPSILNWFIFGLPTFLAVYYGVDAVQAIIDFIPQQIITGLSVGGGMIGAVGIAQLLRSIQIKNVWPYFLLGFALAAYLGVNMVGVALVAAICVAFKFYQMRKEMKQAQLLGIEYTP